jgi:nucleoside-diphosphate-sugar epimerase
MTTAAPGESVRALITGADGFVGRHLQRTFAQRRIEYRAAVRAEGIPGDPTRYIVGDIGPQTDWRAALDGIDVVIHLAARAHVLRETAADPRAAFMRVNAEGTAALVNAAVAAGVRRFIYASSIGVLGSTSGRAAFTPDRTPRPHNAYSESKLAGERAARSAAARLEVVILRLPLVYGAGVRANFLRLLRWVDRGWPLPLAGVENLRSLLSVWNLCDIVMHVLKNPVAGGRTWLISDGEDLSTPELIRRIAGFMQRKARLWRVPVSLLQLLGQLTRQQAQISQLCTSLTVDITQTRRGLGWSPSVSVDEALERTVSWYLSDGRRRKI